MKAIAVILLAFASFRTLDLAESTSIGAIGDLADIIEKLIEEELSKIPDSLSKKNIEVEIPENDLLNGKLLISEVSLTGLKELDTNLKFDKKSSRLNFTLNYPDLAVVLDLTLNLKGLINLDHHLVVHVDLIDYKTEGYAVVSLLPQNVKDLSILRTLGQSKVDIQGLLNNDDLSQKLSEFLTKHIESGFNKINTALSPYISAILKDLINNAL